MGVGLVVGVGVGVGLGVGVGVIVGLGDGEVAGVEFITSFEGRLSRFPLNATTV